MRSAPSRGTCHSSKTAHAHGAAYKGRPAGSSRHRRGRSAFIRPRISARWATAVASSPPTTPLAERIRSVREYGWADALPEQRARPQYPARRIAGRLPQCPPPERPPRTPNAARWRSSTAASCPGVPGLVLPTIPDAVEPVYHLYVVQCPDRDEVQRRLRDRGVGTAVHYPFPVHLQDAYRAAWRSRRTACPLPRRSCRASSACPWYPDSPRPTPLRSPEPSAMSFPL